MTPAYESLRPSLDTGDLVFFAGRGLISSMIKLITRSRYSHVGMIVRPFPGLVLLWESTTLSDKGPPGVQLVSLSSRIETYQGEVAIRRLVDFERTPEVVLRLLELRRGLEARPYESSTVALIAAQFPSLMRAEVDALASVFCSELVATAYIALGLLDPKIAAHHYTPEDFAWRYVTLEGGAQLADEIVVKGDV